MLAKFAYTEILIHLVKIEEAGRLDVFRLQNSMVVGLVAAVQLSRATWGRKRDLTTRMNVSLHFRDQHSIDDSLSIGFYVNMV